MAERSGNTPASPQQPNYLISVHFKDTFGGALSLFRCSYHALKNLKDALIVLIVTVFLFAVWFSHIFQNVRETIEGYCVHNESTIAERNQLDKFNDKSEIILYSLDGQPRLCMKPDDCPITHICHVKHQDRLKLEITSFENIGKSLTVVFVVALNDFWEISLEQVVKYKGKWNIIFYVILIMISYCVATFTLAAVVAAFDKVWKVERNKKKAERSENQGENASQRADISYIDNNELIVTEDKFKGVPQSKNIFRKCVALIWDWECCVCCDKFKKQVHKFIFDPFTQTVLVLCLIFHVGIMLADHDDMDYDLANSLSMMQMAFPFIFMIEAILKIIALSPMGYFKKGWNRFEFFVAALGILQMGLEGVQGLSVLRTVILFIMFRLARFWPSYQLLWKIAYRVMKTQFNFILVLGTFTLLMACAGMYIHGPDYESYMNNNLQESPTRWHMIDYAHSFLMVFRTLCGEWVEGLADCVEISGWSCIPFYVTIVLLGDFILINLFTMFLLSEIVNEDKEVEEISSLVQIMNDSADRLINAWNCIRRKVFRRPNNNNEELTNRARIFQHSKRSRLNEANVEILTENDAVFTITEKPENCCPESCCIPFNSLQSNCWTKIRGMCYFLINTTLFEFTTIIMIALSTVLLALQDDNLIFHPSLKNFLFYTNTIIPIVFVIELAIRLIGRGFKNYFRSGWRTFDFIIIALSLITLTPASTKTVWFFRSLLVTRLLRVLSLTWRYETSRVVFNTLFESVPGLVNVFIIGLMKWILFSIMGVQMFGGKFYSCVDDEGKRVNASYTRDLDDCMYRNFTWINSKINFDDNVNGFLTLTQIATFKGWINIIHNAVDSKSKNDQPDLEVNFYMFIYFVIFIFFGSYFIYIMWFSTIIDGFNRQRDRFTNRRTLSTPGEFIYHKSTKNSESSKIWFDVVIAIIITLNIIKLACHSSSPRNGFGIALEILDIMFVVAYAIEIAFRLMTERLRFFKDWVNVLDLLTVILGLISVSTKNIVFKNIIPIMFLRLIRLTKIIYNRKWTKRFTGLNSILSALTKTVPYLLVITAILAVTVIVYAIVGLFLFQNVPEKGLSNFHTFGNALIVLLQIFVSAGWDSYLNDLLNEEYCYDQNHDCVNPFVSVLYCVSFVLFTYVTIFTTLTVIILEVYSETLSERKLLEQLNESSDGFYQTWSQQDPTITGYINLNELNNLLEMQAIPFKIVKPNDAQIAEMDIPITKGDKVYHRDVLDALYRRVLANKGKPVSAIDNFEALPNTEQDYEPISSTLWRKREINCAKIIQRTWSRYKKQTRM